MSPRTLLSPEQRARLFAVPTSPAEMARHYVLSAKDLMLVRAKRRTANRLGFAVQLCLLRHPGQGPCCVKSPSDRHVAEFVLLVVVSAGLPHHAIREETASPSRTRDPVRRDRSRHYVRLHRFRRPGDGTSGKQGVLAPLQTVPLPLGSTPPRPPGPSGRSCHPPTCGGERPQACAPAPPSLASCRAAWPPPGPNA